MSANASKYNNLDLGLRYQRLFETAYDGILILHAKSGIILDANPFICKLTGYSKEMILNKKLWDLGFIKDIEGSKQKFFELQKKEYVRYENIPLQTKKGEIQHIEFISNSYVVGGIKVIQCNIRDISERVKLEKINSDLSMMYKTIIACNQVLLNELTTDNLIEKMCDVLISSGGFKGAGVAIPPLKSGDPIKTLVINGIDKDYFDQMNLCDGQNKKIGLVKNAVFSHEFCLSHNLENDEKYEFQRALALKYGLHSVAVIPMNSLKKLKYALVVYGKSKQDFTSEVIDLLKNLAQDIMFGIDKLNAHAEHLKMLKKLDNSLNATISAISTMVEQRDPYTAGHQRKVADLAVAIATEMALPLERIKGLRMACIVHDIGKIHIPAEILSKPGLLSDAEYEIIKSHPKSGWEVLKHIDFPWPVAEIVYQHHERLDGSGYPQGLKGNEIMLESQIMMVADVMDAMSSLRPYREAIGTLAALQEIMKQKGVLFDEEVVEACVKLFIEKKYEIK